MSFVFDACALIAYFRNEPGAEVVEDLLIHNPDGCFVHAANLCEVYYDFIRFAGLEEAEQCIQDVKAVGLRIREDMDERFWKAVGESKALIRRISFADCFALTLAQITHSELVTSDHREFDPVVQKGICPIRFIR
jgi:uncharacterized protein with PIN domain